MKRLWMSTASAVLASMLWSPPVFAKGGSVDAFLLAPADRSLPESATAVSSQRGLRIDSMEGRLGVPTFVFSERALRAGPSAVTRSVTPASANTAAREHLRGLADMYRLSRSDVDSAVLEGVHVPAKGEPGAVIARYGRRVNGIEVFRSELKVVMDANQELVAISGYLAPSHASDALNAQPSAFRVSAPQAFARAFSDVTGKTLDTRALSPAGTTGDYRHYDVDTRLASGVSFASAPRVKQVLWPMPDELVPAYYVEVNTGSATSGEADYYAYVISARDNTVLFKHDLTASEAFTYRVWADPSTLLPYDGPQGTESTPHPTGLPDGYQAPLDKPANLVTLQNFPFSRNDPWLAPNALQTTGNNVDAYADLGGGDGFQAGGADMRAPLSDAAARTFGYQYDLTRSPSSSVEQRQAAVVNLFYMNNFLHDWFYDAGFDEASGNAQASNYGRGGLEGDSIRAEAQDSSGRNNANMSTPADGARPRMQQYVFDGVAEVVVSEPSSLARGYESYSAVFGPGSFDVDASLALPPTDSDPVVNNGLRIGCKDTNGTSPYTGTPFAGKIAVIERGTCSFAFKVFNAQKAGAIAVLITNSATGSPGRMGASGVPAIDNAITIPSLMILKPDGDAWRTALGTGAVQLRMRKTADLDRDGTLDNDIVAHEWGHYLSNRLIGNAAGLTNHQGRSMGEGWSDFTALLVQVRAEDAAKPQNANWSGLFTVAGYTQSGGRNQGYYWGIRRVPYTTDMTKNALTLKHIANGTPLPTVHPVSGGQAGTNNSEVHNAGEVWATMLWECYASLLNAYPFNEAQDRMKRYLVAAYKATPNQPTYLEARDAVLAAAAAADASDYQRFIAAFAKRGAGFGAQVPDRGSQDHIGVVESYQTGNTLEVVSLSVDDSVTGCDRDGVLDAGETGYLTVKVRNVGLGDLSAVTATAAINGSSSSSGLVADLPSGSTLSFGNIARGATATARIPVALQEAPAATGLATLAVDVTFPENLPSGSKVAALRTNVNYDEMPNSSNTDSVTTTSTPWSGPILGNNPSWKNQNTGTLTYWHGTDANSALDTQLTSPIFVGADGQNFVLNFKQRYSFETNEGGAPFFDGGVLELSVDGGPWMDVFEFDWYAGTTLNAGYVSYIDTDNPFLSDRPGYVGLSAGFPNFQTVNVNFGPQFSGHEVRIRFRIGADAGVGGYGWDVTNIKVTGTVNPTPFTSRVAEGYVGQGTAPACNVRPVAEAGAVQTVNERTASGDLTVVTLSGATSFDPDAAAAGTLSYAWTQLSGPAVTLSSNSVVEPTFTADVEKDTVFTFQLVVSDGVDSSIPKTTQVLVRNVNRKPTAVASVKDNGPTAVDERSGSVTLDATGSSDPDGEALSFTWVQTAGPSVTMDDPASATPTFTPPEVTADTAFSFELVAADGIDASEVAPITITVRQVDRAPVADAGSDQTVKARSTVTLEGSAVDADGEAISGYEWTQTAGPSVTLSGATTASPSFTAPDVKQDTLVRFSLVATAHGLPSLPNTVDVTVTRSNRKPTLHTGNEGAMSVSERSSVSLEAASEDEDGDSLSFQWTQVGGPALTLSGATTSTLTFTAPEVQADTVLVFRLVARDDLEASEPLEVSVTVKNAPRAPTAKAPTSLSVAEGDTVVLNAAESNDPDAQTLTYLWEQVSGPTVTLSGANSAVATFVSPKTQEKDAVATFRVTVTDPDGLSSTALVTVQLGGAKSGGGCSVGGNGASGALLPALTLLGLLLGRRRRQA